MRVSCHRVFGAESQVRTDSPSDGAHASAAHHQHLERAALEEGDDCGARVDPRLSTGRHQRCDVYAPLAHLLHEL